MSQSATGTISAWPSRALALPRSAPWVGLVLVTAWMVVVFVAFHPGLMSADPLGMLSQGLSGGYSNTNPPLLSFLEAVVFRVTGSVWPLLLVQLVVLNGGMWLLLRRSERPWLATGMLALFILLPPVWATEVAIWKDVAFTCAMVLAVIALSAGRIVPGIVLLVLAGTCRLNGLVGAVPLLFFATLRLPVLRGRSRWVHAVAFVGLTGAAALTPKIVERAFGTRDDWALGWVIADDLSAIYAAHPEAFAGSVLTETTADDIGHLYDPTSSVPLFYDQRPLRKINLETLPDRRWALMREWSMQVGRYPSTYVAERARRFGSLLGLGLDAVHYPFADQIDPNPYGLRLITRTLVYRGLMEIRELSRDSILFRGWAWLLAQAVILLLALRRQGWRSLPFWVAMSGMTYALAYFWIAPAADFRYLFWTIVALFVTSALLISPGIVGRVDRTA